MQEDGKTTGKRRRHNASSSFCCRFGRWRATSPYTVWRSILIVGVLLGVRTGNGGFISQLIKEFCFNFINYSGLVDGSVVIWNPLEMEETKQKRFLPQKHSHRVDSLSFSPDGRFLASADEKIAAVGGWREIAIWSTEVRNRVKDVCTYWTRVRACACCCRILMQQRVNE